LRRRRVDADRDLSHAKDGTQHQDLGADHFDRRSTDVKAKRLVAQLKQLGFQVELQSVADAA
jgi:transposase